MKCGDPEKIKRSDDTARREVQITVILCEHLENPSGAGAERGRGNRERIADVRKGNVDVLANCLSVQLSFLPHCSFLLGVKLCADVVRCSFSANTTPHTLNTPAHVNFSRVAQGSSHQVSSECLCPDKTTIFTSDTQCLTRSRCCSLA